MHYLFWYHPKDFYILVNTDDGTKLGMSPLFSTKGAYLLEFT